LKKIKLYTTLGCHLCDQAEAMVEYLVTNGLTCEVHLSLVEISKDDRLLELYGVRIPVLANETSELAWPFEVDELRAWLRR